MRGAQSPPAGNGSDWGVEAAAWSGSVRWSLVAEPVPRREVLSRHVTSAPHPARHCTQPLPPRVSHGQSARSVGPVGLYVAGLTIRHRPPARRRCTSAGTSATRPPPLRTTHGLFASRNTHTQQQPQLSLAAQPSDSQQPLTSAPARALPLRRRRRRRRAASFVGCDGARSAAPESDRCGPAGRVTAGACPSALSRTVGYRPVSATGGDRPQRDAP